MPTRSELNGKCGIKAGEGVAIQSTIGNMIDSFVDTNDEIHIGSIEYIDYEEDNIPWGNMLGLAMFKRKSFEHENELRAVIMDGDNVPGKPVSVKIDTLIQRIHLAPNTQEWLYELVKKVISKYGLDKDVLNSALDKTPLY